ncbi:MAG: hypothetical protein ACYS83_02365 [Planctomycetota bacterium]
MDLGKDRPVGQFGRHILVIYGILVVLALPVVILVLGCPRFSRLSRRIMRSWKG